MSEGPTGGVMQVRLFAQDRRVVETYFSDAHPFQITPIGVIIEMGTVSEVLIPWHRVQEISTAKRGTIMANMKPQITKRAGTELL